jgi:Baseplate J-like protein
MSTTYVCCVDDIRRNAVRTSATLNGIDYLDVGDLAGPGGVQRRLDVHFLKPLANPLGPQNVRIEGGERVLNPRVQAATPGGDLLTVEVEEAGDFSPYTLRLVTGPLDDRPPSDIDALLSQIEFSFKVNCDATFDCKPERACVVEAPLEPQIDYLAKDYSSFRRLMLDRLAVLVPNWRDRNAADLGIALVELLAYVGDYLSYFQDAVATEAYLGTARRRVSVRRHARLVDYPMHDGSNARGWIDVKLKPTAAIPDPGVLLPEGTKLLTARPGFGPVIDSLELERALGAGGEVFETMHPAQLFRAHKQIDFYAWGAEECCLPKGATSATLRGNLPNLHAGQILLLEELVGPETGNRADADPSHRHAVRLIDVAAGSDPLGGAFDEPATTNAVDVTEIHWHDDDALPFPLCISAKTELGYIAQVSCARGNIVLADHGLSVGPEQLGPVPAAAIFEPPLDVDRCADHLRRPIPPRFRPQLAERPLTQAAPHGDRTRADDDPSRPATAATRWDVSEARPQIGLEANGIPWEAHPHLLGAGPATLGFVVEVEADGSTALRFGDDRHGRRPEEGLEFDASYRVGNGTSGNVGAGAIAHVVTADTQIEAVTNRLPAVGGLDPESSEHARQSAPSAFRTQQRAVTPDDYGEVATRFRTVQRAAANLRWTGSWRTMLVSADRFGGRKVDERFRHELLEHLDRFRMAGQDVDVGTPRFVSLEVELFVCVDHEHFRGDVERAIRRLFGSGTLPDGRRALFHPDNFTFGQPVYLSPLYEAAQSVPGVESVEIRKFRRQGIALTDAVDSGILLFGTLEIPRLDQDPNFPEHGKLTLSFGGGK